MKSFVVVLQNNDSCLNVTVGEQRDLLWMLQLVNCRQSGLYFYSLPHQCGPYYGRWSFLKRLVMQLSLWVSIIPSSCVHPRTAMLPFSAIISIITIISIILYKSKNLNPTVFRTNKKYRTTYKSCHSQTWIQTEILRTLIHQGHSKTWTSSLKQINICRKSDLLEWPFPQSYT